MKFVTRKGKKTVAFVEGIPVAMLVVRNFEMQKCGRALSGIVQMH